MKNERPFFSRRPDQSLNENRNTQDCVQFCLHGKTRVTIGAAYCCCEVDHVNCKLDRPGFTTDFRFHAEQFAVSVSVDFCSARIRQSIKKFFAHSCR